jgi:serine protease Do
MGGERERELLEKNEAERGEIREKLSEAWSRPEPEREQISQLITKMRELEDERDQLLERLGRGTGSGILYDDQGHILTNNHVVDGRSAIRVRLSDEREYDAVVVGTDAKTDLAVLKVEAIDLHPLVFGDSDQMEVGDWVLAVGAPFGLSQSVTHGIISAKGRHDIATGRREIQYQDFMQTDAAINPGNSGGPLVNMRGEVVGINTAIATDGSGFNAGVAFTIPSNMARKIAEQLKSHGSVARGWLGVGLLELSETDVSLLGLKDGKGAMVNVIYEGSPGFKAGLQCEDVIVRVDGRKVTDIPSLKAAVADVAPGGTAEMTIIRDGRERALQVRVDRQPDNIDAFVNSSKAIIARPVGSLALNVRSLTRELPYNIWRWSRDRDLANTAGAYESKQGAFIVTVNEAARTGAYNLSPGDVVVSANDTPVASAADLMKALEQSKSRNAVELQIMNVEGEKRTVEVRLK